MRKRRTKRGIALVVALYTIAILLTLGVTFIALAISNSRNSAAGKDAQQALQFANAGLEIAMNYLSQGGNSISTSGSDRGFRIVPVTQSRFSGDDFSTSSLGDISGLCDFTVTSSAKMYDAVSDSSLVSGFADIADPAGIIHRNVVELVSKSPVPITYNTNEGNRVGTLDIVMRFLTPGANTMVPPQYIVRCRSKIFKAGETDASKYIASRVVEYKVRRVAASDYMLFMQNARGWDAYGAAPPNATDRTNDCVGVPSEYKIDGDVRIEGDRVKGYDQNNNSYSYNSGGYDANNASASESAPTPTGTDNRSGNLQFFDLSGNSGSEPKVKFTGTTSVARSDNAYASGSSQDQVRKIYSEGFFQNWGSQFSGARHQMGLPGSKGYLNEMNSDGSIANGTARQNAGLYIKVASNDGAAVFVNPDNPAASTGGDVEYNDPAKDTTSAGKSVSHIPGFAIVRLTMNYDTNTGKTSLNYQKVGKYSGKVLEQKTISDINDKSQLPNKVVYVEGGNVQVSGNIGGQLTIVAADNPERRPVRTTSQNSQTFKNTIYTDWAKQQQEAGGTPPFRHDYGGGIVRMEFPPPPQIATDAGQPVRVTREGNLTITGDTKYAQGSRTPSSLGLISKNYIFLNSATNNSSKELNVNGVLMSLEHSVQFDWDKNFSYRDTGWSDVTDSTFKLTGSIVSKYADVEGQFNGVGSTGNKGYITQQFAHDPNLKYTQPPSFPQWARQQLLYVNYVILSYTDKGAVTAF